MLLSFAVALIVIMNPIGNLAIYSALIENRNTEECNKTAKTCAIAIFSILMIALWIGWPILNFFGISIGAFEFAGSLIILRIALSMIKGHSHTHDKEKTKQLKYPSIAVVPMATPVIAGPGSMVVIISHANEFTITQFIYASVICLIISVFFWLLLKFTPKFASHIGDETMAVISRIMGLILAAIAIQMAASGLILLFPVLGS
ncbi:MarC family protein [Fastidiosibacter lacustris]|uniref:MarC family protein n=1 Tax=Fastidiosibacter lacustris TaxID=2056695 RepID=UPI000E3470EF|nr:MarC family protein [Fastidiosibacter lacustris]